MTVKELDEKFSKWGQIFTQIRKTDSGYIYARTDSEGIICYEVFKRLLKKLPAGKLGGFDYIPTHDRYIPYPGNESFGYWAWCFKSLKKAEEKLEELSKENPREDPGATLTIETNNS